MTSGTEIVSRAKLKMKKLPEQRLCFPLASIIETGNHISQMGGDRMPSARRLAEVMNDAADEITPWAAFGDQSQLWSPEHLKSLADKWPPLAVQQLSLGDATIKDVADYYARTGFRLNY